MNWVVVTWWLTWSRALAVHHRQETYMWPGRSGIVHLFEWKWLDVAQECENFLAPKGFGAVQVSPPSENVVEELGRGERSWRERYRPVSYLLTTRSGNPQEFQQMVARCNAVGVRIYVDVVLNHMAGGGASEGTGSSRFNLSEKHFPSVPYEKKHFRPHNCTITDYNNPYEVRNCQLGGNPDLAHEHEHVTEVVLDYLNRLLHLGVAGFRIDSAMYMWPGDLSRLYMRVDRISDQLFPLHPGGGRPFIYQEFDARRSETLSPEEYLRLGAVTDFHVGLKLSKCFREKNQFRWLRTWSPEVSRLPEELSVVFVDSHTTQREQLRDGSCPYLTYNEPRLYRAASGLLLARSGAEPLLMSSYSFDKPHQGPPAHSKDGSLISPYFYSNGACGPGWVCEHRWRQIYEMVGFRNAMKDAPVRHWWDSGAGDQLAFSRGDRGFVVFNNDLANMNEKILTGLPAGDYCDVISGGRRGDTCAGLTLSVDTHGFTRVRIPHDAADMFIAIHVGTQSLLRKMEERTEETPLTMPSLRLDSLE